MVDKYIEKFGFDDLANICLSVLEQYFQFNQDRQIANPELEAWIGKTNRIHGHIRGELQTGGSHPFTKQELVESTRLDLSGFFASRHSIRNFTNNSVSLDLISQAVQMAQFTPSVCNRQAARISVLHTAEDKEKALSYQNGNRGFGHTADKVLVISSNLKSYNSVGERNQCWIDGGMFAMSLVYALHSLGLGTCCLNWCVENDVDRSFKQELSIPDSDAIAMLILVGYMPDKIQVATSRRKHLEEVLFVHN
ncbi:nitroreductase family protein [Waterburya agarophytonicola K14]|uniref:Nitroreductase family protein n=2 Tax=Waterburya TaxID=2886915 RepID=A0A964FH32_9CYAN|nr:nitroreductase family protein [Waterburya agarophytonicola KI4]